MSDFFLKKTFFLIISCYQHINSLFRKLKKSRRFEEHTLENQLAGLFVININDGVLQCNFVVCKSTSLPFSKFENIIFCRKDVSNKLKFSLVPYNVHCTCGTSFRTIQNFVFFSVPPNSLLLKMSLYFVVRAE